FPPSKERKALLHHRRSVCRRCIRLQGIDRGTAPAAEAKPPQHPIGLQRRGFHVPSRQAAGVCGYLEREKGAYTWRSPGSVFPLPGEKTGADDARRHSPALRPSYPNPWGEATDPDLEPAGPPDVCGQAVGRMDRPKCLSEGPPREGGNQAEA